MGKKGHISRVNTQQTTNPDNFGAGILTDDVIITNAEGSLKWFLLNRFINILQGIRKLDFTNSDYFNSLSNILLFLSKEPKDPKDPKDQEVQAVINGLRIEFQNSQGILSCINNFLSKAITETLQQTQAQRIKIVKDLVEKYPFIAVVINTLLVFNKDEFDVPYYTQGEPIAKKLNTEVLELLLPESWEVLKQIIFNIDKKDKNLIMPDKNLELIYNTIFDALKIPHQELDLNNTIKEQKCQDIYKPQRTVFVFIIRTLYYKKYQELNEFLNYILPVNLDKFLNVLIESEDTEIQKFLHEINENYKESQENLPNVTIFFQRMFHKISRHYTIKLIEIKKDIVEINEDPLLISILKKIHDILITEKQLPSKNSYNDDQGLKRNTIKSNIMSLIVKSLEKPLETEIIFPLQDYLNDYISVLEKFPFTKEEYQKISDLIEDFNWKLVFALLIRKDKNSSDEKALLKTIFQNTDYADFFETNILSKSDTAKISTKLIHEHFQEVSRNSNSELYVNLSHEINYKEKRKNNVLLNRIFDFFTLINKLKIWDDKMIFICSILHTILDNTNTLFVLLTEGDIKVLKSILNRVMPDDKKKDIEKHIKSTEEYIKIVKEVQTLYKQLPKNLYDDFTQNPLADKLVFLDDLLTKTLEYNEFTWFQKIYNILKQKDTLFKINLLNIPLEQQTTILNNTLIKDDFSLLFWFIHEKLVILNDVQKNQLIQKLILSKNWTELLTFLKEKIISLNDTQKNQVFEKFIETENWTELLTFLKEKIISLNDTKKNQLIQKLILSKNWTELLTFLKEKIISLNDTQKNQVFEKLILSKNWTELLTFLKEKIIFWTSETENLFYENWTKAIEQNKDLPYRYENNLNLKYNQIKQRQDQEKIDAERKAKENENKLESAPNNPATKTIPEKFQKAFNKYFGNSKIPENLGQLFDFILEKNNTDFLQTFLNYAEEYYIFITQKNYPNIIQILGDTKPKALKAYENALEKENKKKAEAKRQKEVAEKKQQNIDQHPILYAILEELIKNNPKNQDGAAYKTLLETIENGNVNFDNKTWQKVYFYLTEKHQQEENQNLEQTLANLTEELSNQNNLPLKTVKIDPKNLQAQASAIPVEPINSSNQDFIDWSNFIDWKSEFRNKCENCFVHNQILNQLTPEQIKNYQEILASGHLRTQEDTKCIDLIKDSEFELNGMKSQLFKIKNQKYSLRGYIFEINEQKLAVITHYNPNVNDEHKNFRKSLKTMKKNASTWLNKFSEFYKIYQEQQTEHQNDQNAINQLAYLTKQVQEVGNQVQGLPNPK